MQNKSGEYKKRHEWLWKVWTGQDKTTVANKERRNQTARWRTRADCPMTESFESLCRLCSPGKEPGEAVEHRLRQRWINRLNIRAREWQQARGHKHPDYWFWSLLNCSSQGIRMPSSIYSCTHIKSWQTSLLYLCLSFFHYYCPNQTQSSYQDFCVRLHGQEHPSGCTS